MVPPHPLLPGTPGPHQGGNAKKYLNYFRNVTHSLVSPGWDDRNAGQFVGAKKPRGEFRSRSQVIRSTMIIPYPR